jgi:4-amino-4-deoxy-L-arabinose transferase-like glycosyltransferase
MDYKYPDSWRLERPALILLLLTYLVVGALYAVKTPDWQTPDEPAHYNYIAQLDADGCCPVMAAGDYDQAYLDEIRGAMFAPDTLGRLDTVQYEDYQPPLYYLLQWPVYALTDGDLAVMRLFSVVIGAGVVLMAWATVRVLFPVRPWMALSAAAFVAFVPQHLAMMAGVNNDSLAELWIGGVLLASVLYVRGGELGLPRPHPGILGVLAGLGGLTKPSAYFVVAVALAAVWLRWRRERAGESGHQWRTLLVGLAWVAGVMVLLNAPWWLHNIDTYGFPDFTGKARHDEVVVGQPRTADWIDANGVGSWAERWVRFTFNSFWGQFGWMAVPMPDRFYTLLLAFSVLVLVGVGLGLRRNRYKHDEVAPAQRDGVLLLALTLLLVAAQYVYYNVTFVQHQGRYLFLALIPIGFVVALGLDGWMRPLVGPDMGRYRLPLWARWIPSLVLWAALAALSVYALWRWVVPNLAL